MTLRLIAAVSPEFVIGLNGTIPWRYPGDMRRFKRVTMGSTIVMGRRTWESIGRVLPGRRNVVVGHNIGPNTPDFAELNWCSHVDIPVHAWAHEGDIWFIGGHDIYKAALPLVKELDITYVPDHVTDPAAVLFPHVDWSQWESTGRVQHEDEPALEREVWRRR